MLTVIACAFEFQLCRIRRHIVEDGSAALRADLAGERIDRRRHLLLSDVKAATAHALRVKRTRDGWTVSATLDVSRRDQEIVRDADGDYGERSPLRSR